MAVLTWLLLGAVVMVVLRMQSKPRQAKSGEKLPPVVGGLVPFFGCIAWFARDPLGIVKSSYAKLGEIFTLSLCGYHMTFLVGAEGHAAFFAASDEEVSPKEAYRFVVPVFGRGVVYDSPTHIMYEQLKFVRSALQTSALKRHVGSIVEEAKGFMSEFWGDEGERELLDDMNNTTIRTASRCLLGSEITDNPEVKKRFADLYHDLEGGLNPLAFFYPYLPIPAHRKRDAARGQVSTLFSQILAERRAKLAAGATPPQDMTQVLLDAVYKNGETLDDDKIAGLLVGALFAGQHTSGITTTWTLMRLTASKDTHLRAVLREQQDILARFGEDISFESIRESHFLHACVRETLRLNPPLIHLMRKVKKPLSYKGYTIPAGDLVCISPGAVPVAGHYGDSANVWDPTRFAGSPNAVNEDTKAYHYIAFGGGRHGCPGEAFGILQIMTLLTLMLRTYEFELPAGIPEPDFTNLVVGPTQPAKIRFKKRETPITEGAYGGAGAATVSA